MLERGFVIVDRSLLTWRWYKDSNTMRLFFHLLMTANYEDREFEDITIRRGQRVSSLSVLADELGLSVKNVRTAIGHLEKTGDLARTVRGKYTVFTLNHYDEFVMPASIGHTDGTESAEKGQGIGSNVKKNNKYNNYNKAKSAAPADGFDPDKYSVFINRF